MHLKTYLHPKKYFGKVEEREKDNGKKNYITLSVEKCELISFLRKAFSN